MAIDNAADPNSVGRLREKYAKNKNNEEFVGKYLDKLAGQSKSYVDVLENYLRIQKSIPDTSKQMVLLLAKHSNQLVFGGYADRIIKDNMGTDAWKKYVRKNVREVYQKIPRKILKQTTEYAIEEGYYYCRNRFSKCR